MVFPVPETKRTMYYIVKNYIDANLDMPLFESSDRVVGISGPRHCGKTVLLKQLANCYGDLVFYKEYTDNEDYTTLYDNVINSNKRIVIIDEVCKASNAAQIKFCADVKNLQNASKFVIFTGSVSGVLESLSDSIGRGGLFNLDIISYYEWLCWKNKIEADLGMNLSLYKGLSNNKSFLDYLYYLKFKDIPKHYITSVISDTCVSVSNRHRLNFKVSKLDLLKTIKYLSIQEITQSLVKLPDIQSHGDIDEILNDAIQNINTEYQKLLPEVKHNCLKLLLDSGLLKELHSSINAEKHTYVFAYPWILTEYLDEPLQDLIKPIEDIWVEACLLKAVSDIYNDCGKYRKDDASAEIDIVYSKVLREIYTIEVKNARLSNELKKARNERVFANEIAAQEFIFTYSDASTNVTLPENAISNNLLLLCLNIYSIYLNSYVWLSGNRHLSPNAVYGVSNIIKELSKILPLNINNHQSNTETNFFK